MKAKTIGLIGITIFALLITIISIVAQVEILDPVGDVKRNNLDTIIATININNTPRTCWYNLIEEDIVFDCELGMNEFEIDVDYFGPVILEVFVKDLSGVVFDDSVEFEIISQETLILKDSPGENINIDNLLCVGDKCLWDDDSFVEYIFFISILGIIVLAYYDQR